MGHMKEDLARTLKELEEGLERQMKAIEHIREALHLLSGAPSDIISSIDRCEELVQQYTQYALSALDCFEDTAFIRELSLHLIQRMK